MAKKRGKIQTPEVPDRQRLFSLPIVVRGAREHNLRNVNLELPRNELICFTGVSGSGKSSLAFDTLFAEGQRRYLESLSTYARQFVGQMPKPDVDFLSGLAPAISISQKSTGFNPRSTVGTITELNDFLRVFFARCGTAHCPNCHKPLSRLTQEQMLQIIEKLPAGPYALLVPLIRNQRGSHESLFVSLERSGFNRVRIDGVSYTLENRPELDRSVKHSIDVVYMHLDLPLRDSAVPDELPNAPSELARLVTAIEGALKLGRGMFILAPDNPGAASAVGTQTKKPRGRTAKANATSSQANARDVNEGFANQRITGSGATAPASVSDTLFAENFACSTCQQSYPEPTPQLLSFNSKQGACETCQGLGIASYFTEESLVKDPEVSIQKGAIPALGPWKSLSMWVKRGLNDYVSSVRRLTKFNQDLLKTSWKSIPAEARRLLLFNQLDGDFAISCPVFRPADQEFWNFPGLAGYFSMLCDSNPAHKERLEKYMTQVDCPDCTGHRLNPYARSIRVRTRSEQFSERSWCSISECAEMSIDQAAAFFEDVELTSTQQIIATEALKEIRNRLRFLKDVGLGYLSLGRGAPSLSGGESQRIRLASQIGAGLTGVLYVLDEPSIGLHPRDNDKLLRSLKHLRDLGNTLIVVEHDEDTMRAADRLVDFGPGPGVKGGELISAGSLEELACNPQSVTGGFLGRRLRVRFPHSRRHGNGKHIIVRGAAHHNLKGIDVKFPLGMLVAVTGVSGSGKSSLVTDILSPALRNALNGAEDTPGKHETLQGLEHLDKIIDIDQSPIGRTPRSNPATYTKLFDEIRDLFAELPESKRRGFAPGTFSFNTELGRCTACDGHGANRLDMEFLPDLWVPCAVCEGRRYNRATLQVLFKGKSIADCLDLDVQQAIEHFGSIPNIVKKLKTLADVGLDYIKLGQPSPTLSGGEAQRIKLARELSKRSTGKTLIVLDEPTTGLHFHDIDMLLGVLQNLVDKGNTVVVVEHNLDLIQAADWIIDLGPEGGAAGGQVICEGTPEEVASSPDSHTGVALKRYFEDHCTEEHASAEHGASIAASTKKVKKAKKATAKGKGASDESKTLAAQSDKEKSTAETNNSCKIAMLDVQVVGASQHNLKNVDVTIPKNAMTVFCGYSGSGKTSMALETIYAEGQRRFVESLNPYVRQFVGQMQKPSVERIDGLSPAIAIEQRAMSHTPRSTVGTVTEIQDYLRVLYARLGVMHCTQCDQPVESQTIDQILDRWMQWIEEQLADPNGARRCMLMAPVVPSSNQTLEKFFNELQLEGYTRVRINGQTREIGPEQGVVPKSVQELQVVVDRFTLDQVDRNRLADSAAIAMSLGNGIAQLAVVNEKLPEKRWIVQTHSLQSACHVCGISYASLTPHHFSFNTSIGWCPSCSGLGVEQGADPALFLHDHLSLLEGGFVMWPHREHPFSQGMLRALARNANLPLQLPIGKWTSRQRHVLLQGLPDVSISVFQSDVDPELEAAKDREVLRYRFRGLFPALELESKRSNEVRGMLWEVLADVPCRTCHGDRLRDQASHVRLFGRTIGSLMSEPIGELTLGIEGLKWDTRTQKIGGELRREVEHRLKFLVDVGLEYLTLGRAANTLSGGESQRIRLASQLGTGLSGVLYVLDEPTIGLHPRDNGRLIRAMHKLRDLGNTVLVVEHDRDVIASSDEIRDFGPGAGPLGGRVVAQGTPDEMSHSENSVTGPYLSGAKEIALPRQRQVNPYVADAANLPENWLRIKKALHNTLKSIDVDIPLKRLIAVTGPSGSGKSSLIQGILYPALAQRLLRVNKRPGYFESIEGVDQIGKVLQVDQSPLGASPSSTPATYVEVFDLIRNVFSKQPAARQYYRDSFSFNTGYGRCSRCEGLGKIKVEMHFLPAVWIDCEECEGKRYKPEILSVKYKGFSIHDVLEMSAAEALKLFEDVPKIASMLDVMCRVGLDYIKLGQSSSTLSGGESQRVKLAAELCKPNDGKTLFLLDEPTTGLHFEDIRKLLHVLDELVNRGNTVLIIEHNLEVIRSADWVIDLGPEAGREGGELVFAGTPEALVKYAKSAVAKGGKRSYTGEALADWESNRAKRK